jgi:cell pole-organizing protein PopZ
MKRFGDKLGELITVAADRMRSLAEVSEDILKPVFPDWLERVAPLIEKPAGGVHGVPSRGSFEQN